MTAKKPPQRRRRSDCKFEQKFADQLRSGIRYTHHYTIAHLCMKWKISRNTYDNWVANYPEFARAHEIAKQHYEAYIHDCAHGIMDGSQKGNAAMLQFYLTNVAGWATKVDVNTRSEESIGNITINILPSPSQKTLEHLPDNCIEGQLVLPDNVVKLHDA